jgi:hypothetical protein
VTISPIPFHSHLIAKPNGSILFHPIQKTNTPLVRIYKHTLSTHLLRRGISRSSADQQLHQDSAIPPHDVATYVTPLEHSNAYKDIKISGNQIEEGSTNTVRTDNMMFFLPGIVKRKL